MSVQFTFRPLSTWPGTRTAPGARTSGRFRAPYDGTIAHLTRELEHLGAARAVIELDLREQDIRLDGLPRAAARPGDPGVILSFTGRHGPLRYATDAFTDWQANLRAIALGLQALRAVDRYGISRRGEQYSGWRELGAGGEEDELARGRRLIAEHGGFRTAAKATHPDAGGDPADFRAVMAAKEAGAT